MLHQDPSIYSESATVLTLEEAAVKYPSVSDETVVLEKQKQALLNGPTGSEKELEEMIEWIKYSRSSE